MSEAEVVHQILELWPDLGEHAGYVLWNCSAFPFYEGDDPLSYWITQVALYVGNGCKEEELT